MVNGFGFLLIPLEIQNPNITPISGKINRKGKYEGN
ncbi:hypothetical protein P872_18285 [Rhodonellum psychrophilum GCM71 = DSM 17998]|uniref:Uncharacterized protein n=1 Tax=Rhodonellum psychrophilum GCM71 = DSM 17998 TaxID=1123057 RepID=U5C2G9_9BACT|nr:hypothetical protein P872_18285 [Rhodonellum psychrophilum GCM71 = DSM 17998]